MTNHIPETLSEDEKMLFSDLLSVMERHGDVGARFNIRRAHNHFPISDQEVYLENNDPVSRTMITTVVPRASVHQHTVETEWRLSRDADGHIVITCCTNCCIPVEE